jgi:citrate synthase
MEHVIHEK